MTQITFQGGKAVMRDGKVQAGANCCCCQCPVDPGNSPLTVSVPDVDSVSYIEDSGYVYETPAETGPWIWYADALATRIGACDGNAINVRAEVWCDNGTWRCRVWWNTLGREGELPRWPAFPFLPDPDASCYMSATTELAVGDDCLPVEGEVVGDWRSDIPGPGTWGPPSDTNDSGYCCPDNVPTVTIGRTFP